MSSFFKKNTCSICFTFALSLFIAPILCHAAEYDRETPVVRAVRLASPVVVNISSEHEIRKRANPFSGFGMDTFFDSFFKDFFDPRFEQRHKRSSLGSGVIIDGKRGFILTNAHVIEKTGKITVGLKDEREFKATIVGIDPDSDLAVLRISSNIPLPAIDMGNSEDLMIGETVIAIGNPFGFSNTVTTGVISALNRSIRTDVRVFQDFIQTDASINPGNSGGPLLNIAGELIGINTAIYAKAQGIGFAIPINKAKRIVSDLIRYGEVIQAWIGITVQNIDPGLARYLNLSKAKGVLVTGVVLIGPAHKAGIREGDILLSVGKRRIKSNDEYLLTMKSFAAGDKIKMHMLRRNEEKTLLVAATVFPLALAKDLAYSLLGIKVENWQEDGFPFLKKQLKKGVAIKNLHSRSYLFRIGVRSGDIIRQINETTTGNTTEFEKAIVKYRNKKSLVLLLQREDQLYHITVKL